MDYYTPEVVNRILQNGSEESLILMLQTSLLRQDNIQFGVEMIEAVFQAAQQRNLDIQSYISENVYIGDVVGDFIGDGNSADQARGIRRAQVSMIYLRKLLDVGLNPNLIMYPEIHPMPLFVAAFDAPNYEFAEMVLNTPGFHLTLQLLQEINQKMMVADRIREVMVSRLGNQEPALKRSRYDLV